METKKGSRGPSESVEQRLFQFQENYTCRSNDWLKDTCYLRNGKAHFCPGAQCDPKTSCHPTLPAARA